MAKPPKRLGVCPSCGRKLAQHQSDLSEERDECPYCGQPLVPEHKFDQDSETVEDRDKVDEDETPEAF